MCKGFQHFKNGETSVLLLMGATNNVAASCMTAGYNKPGRAADISGKQILAVGGGDDWREDHCVSGDPASGDLYKLGAGTAVDPYAFRGTWSILGNNVQYHYTVGGNSSYNWYLYKNTSGALCWQDTAGTIIATASAPGPAGACGSPMMP